MNLLRKKLFSKWRRKKQPSILILLYHRVANLETDPQLLSVTPQHFTEQMEILKKNFAVLDLQEIRYPDESRKDKSPTVVITFDDGYADNLYIAKPILERFDLPATIFITTEYVKDPCEFWWDELEKIFLNAGDLPGSLSLEEADKSLHWDLGSVRAYSTKHFDDHRSWHVAHEDTPTVRHEIYRYLCNFVRPLRTNQREKILAELRNWCGLGSTPRTSHRPLLRNEVSELGKGLVKIGAHTKTHPVLSQLPAEEQFVEIEGSKTYLEEITGQSVPSFAYPFGTRADYTAETVKLVKKAGFDNACSNFEPETDTRLDFFQMPRFIVRDWSGDKFYQNLLELYRDE